jgi:hypothetical protein
MEVNMKRRTLTIGLFLIAIGAALAGALAAQAQRQATGAQPQNPTAANYTLSGPYSHKNLTIFLLHGAD